MCYDLAESRGYMNLQIVAVCAAVVGDLEYTRWNALLFCWWHLFGVKSALAFGKENLSFLLTFI